MSLQYRRARYAMRVVYKVVLEFRKRSACRILMGHATFENNDFRNSYFVTLSTELPGYPREWVPRREWSLGFVVEERTVSWGIGAGMIKEIIGAVKESRAMGQGWRRTPEGHIHFRAQPRRYSVEWHFALRRHASISAFLIAAKTMPMGAGVYFSTHWLIGR
jgi:hypothetical protein